jgi:hypothetical protein
MNQILETALKVIEIGSISFGSVWLNNHLERKSKEKKKPDLYEKSIDDLVSPILELIQYEINPIRVSYWEGVNGTNTLSGFSIKKLSMMAEVIREGEDETKEQMQSIPIESFKRNIDDLRDSDDDYIVSNEFKKYDNLSALHARFKNKTLIAIKVYTKGKWTGILMIGFDEEPRLFTESEIEWLRLQAGRIGNLVSENIK